MHSLLEKQKHERRIAEGNSERRDERPLRVGSDRKSENGPRHAREDTRNGPA